MRSILVRFVISTLACLCVISSTCLNPTRTVADQSNDVVSDQDGDGLSDFQEQHKYFTNPTKSDSDGDGTPDGDWLERREYQYTIRSVIQVMRPVTIDYLNDDYQDARILDETDDYVELEVIHYPFNTVAETIRANPDWRMDAAKLDKWLAPGPSADWTPEMQSEMVAELKKDGIDLDELDDKQLVKKVSSWLVKRAKQHNGFASFSTAWDENGNPYLPEEFHHSLEKNLQDLGLEDVKQQFEREVSAKGMFKHKTRGSCTSSAIYLNGCMRAAGVPTRTILVVPLIDASDDREFRLLHQIKNTSVRSHLLRALRPLANSWSSHTFNEVFVGGRWHRLNYSHLGQNIYDRQMYGLVTHIATFRDWADAKAHETIGKRQKSQSRGNEDLFGFNNPYSTISLRDEMGQHSKVEIPEVKPAQITVKKIHWTDDDALPKQIVDNCKRKNRFGFIAIVTGFEDSDTFKEFVGEADTRVFLHPTDDAKKTIKIGFDPNCWWFTNKQAYVYVPFGTSDKHDIEKNVEYAFTPRNNSDTKWKLSKELIAVRNEDIPNLGPDVRDMLPRQR